MSAAPAAPVDVIEPPFARHDVVVATSQYGCASQSRLEFVMASIPSQIGAALSLSGPFRSPCQGKVGMQRIRIREASWPADKMALETVRCEVFVKEQNVSRSLEFDGLDARALHWLAFTPEGEPVGTLRLLPSGQIGRAAVLRAYRGQGIGSRLLRHAIAAAEAHGWGEVWVNAQYARRGFYAPHGFIVITDIFADAGIPHQRMLRRLNGNTARVSQGQRTS